MAEAGRRIRPVLPMFVACAVWLFVVSCSPNKEEAAFQGTVVVYSPHGPDVLRDYEDRFEAAYPGVDMQWLDMGSQDVYNRVKSEQRRPQADVWWGAPSPMFMQAAGEGLLAPYKPSWADAVDAAYKDPQDRWYGTYRSPLGIVYNMRAYAEADVPHTWDALLEPAWAGKITLRKPHPSGTMRTFIGAIFLRAGSQQAAIDWLTKLHQSTEAYMENPQFLYEHLKKREDLISVWIMPDVILQRQRHGYPLACVVPPDTPVITEGIAIIEGAPHREWAEKFYEFVTTQEALAHQAHAYAKVPTREDIDPSSLPESIANLDIKPMAIDWQAFADKEQEWLDLWDKQVYQAQ